MTKEFLKEGFTSKSYTVDSDYILLVGKNEQAITSYRKQKDILSFLRGKIFTVKLPIIDIIYEPTSTYSFGGLKYKKIAGVVLTSEVIAQAKLDSLSITIANFLNELHNICIFDFKKNLNIDEIKKEKMILIDENIKSLLNYISKKEANKLFDWRDKYMKYFLTFDGFCLVHGDLWYENYIMNEDYSVLLGIVDWECSTISDPADDLCALLYLGEQFLNKVISQYKNSDTNLLERIMLNKQKRELIHLKYVIDYCDDLEVKEQLAKIRASGILG